MIMSELIKRLKEERIQGSDAVLNYSNFDYWVNWDDIVEIVEDHDQPQLNDNQQIVLEWLKLQAPTAKPMQVIFWMMNNAAWGKIDELRKPIMHLTDIQQAQVLEEFGKWVQEQEAE